MPLSSALGSTSRPMLPATTTAPLASSAANASMPTSASAATVTAPATAAVVPPPAFDDFTLFPIPATRRSTPASSLNGSWRRSSLRDEMGDNSDDDEDASDSDEGPASDAIRYRNLSVSSSSIQPPSSTSQSSHNVKKNQQAESAASAAAAAAGNNDLMWEMDPVSSVPSDGSSPTSYIREPPVAYMFPPSNPSQSTAASPLSLSPSKRLHHLHYLHHQRERSALRTVRAASRPSPIQTLAPGAHGRHHHHASHHVRALQTMTPLKNTSGSESGGDCVGSGGSDAEMLLDDHNTHPSHPQQQQKQLSASEDGMEGVKTAKLKAKTVSRIARLLESEHKPFESEVIHERTTLALLNSASSLLAEHSASAHSQEESPLGMHSFVRQDSMGGGLQEPPRVGLVAPRSSVVSANADPSAPLSPLGLEFITRPLPIPANQIKDPKQYVSHSSRLNPENAAFIVRAHDQITHSPSLSPVLRPGSMSPSLERKGKRKLSFDDRYEPYKRRLPPSPSGFPYSSSQNHVFSPTPPPPPPTGFGLGSPMMMIINSPSASSSSLGIMGSGTGGGGRARSLSASSNGSAAMSVMSGINTYYASSPGPATMNTGGMWGGTSSGAMMAASSTGAAPGSGGGGGSHHHPYGGAAYFGYGSGGGGGFSGNNNTFAAPMTSAINAGAATLNGVVSPGGAPTPLSVSGLLRPGSPRIGLLAAAVQGAAVQAQQAAAAAALQQQQQQQQQLGAGGGHLGQQAPPVLQMHGQLPGQAPQQHQQGAASPVKGLGQMLNITGAQGGLMKMSLS